MKMRGGRTALGRHPLHQGNRSLGACATSWCTLLCCSCVSFYAGVLAGLTVLPRPHECGGAQSAADCAEPCRTALRGGQGELARALGAEVEALLAKGQAAKCPPSAGTAGAGTAGAGTGPRFDRKLSHFAAGLARVNRAELFSAFDFGVPMDGNADAEDVLLLYDQTGALPSDPRIARDAQGRGAIPSATAAAATANCGIMNAMFIDKYPGMKQCLAIVGGQYQGHHLQRWMRVVGEGPKGKFDRTAPLKLTGRMTKTSGYDELVIPSQLNVQSHQAVLLRYLQNLDEIKRELKSILERVAVHNTVIVSTVNQGQSELLANFVCSSRARGFDVGNLLVFPTDAPSRDLAEGLGVATYYAEKLMAFVPAEESARYGDSLFGKIMLAKVVCVHLVSELGYDLLFQDVDLVWLRDPRPFFRDPRGPAGDFDVYFQDDGNRQERFAPYSANSGFYYVRHNSRTQLFFRQMLYAGDLIFSSRSHQQVLIQLMAEANSLTGLKVKILSRDGEGFPSGWHFNMKRDFMTKFIKGETQSYIFHMCWTLNKDDKVKYMRQMGMWYVRDECIGENAAANHGDAAARCCAAEPLVTCHYRDKPSITSCASSPPKDKGRASFW